MSSPIWTIRRMQAHARRDQRRDRKAGVCPDRCYLVRDEAGDAFSYHGQPLDEETRAALLSLVEAARRQHEAMWTPEDQARSDAARARNHERLLRLGLLPQTD